MNNEEPEKTTAVQKQAKVDNSWQAQIFNHMQKQIEEKQEKAFEKIQWLELPEDVLLSNPDNKLIIRLNNSWRILAMIGIKEKLNPYGDAPYFQWFVSAAILSALSGKVKLSSTYTRKERKYLIYLTQALVYNINKHPQWFEEKNFCIATCLCNTNDLEVIKVARAEYLESLKPAKKAKKRKVKADDTVENDNREVHSLGTAGEAEDGSGTP